MLLKAQEGRGVTPCVLRYRFQPRLLRKPCSLIYLPWNVARHLSTLPTQSKKIAGAKGYWQNREHALAAIDRAERKLGIQKVMRTIM